MSSLGARHSSGAIIFEAGSDTRHKAKVTSPEESRAPSHEERPCFS
jgi:hypothetical protein